MSKTVAEKLLIKPGANLWISHPDRTHLLEPLPDGVGTADSLASATLGFIFADDAEKVREILTAQHKHLAKPAILWVAYPKSPKVNLNRDSLWKILVDYGMRPNGQVAVDDDWSAMRYRALNDGEAPFTGGGSKGA